MQYRTQKDLVQQMKCFRNVSIRQFKVPGLRLNVEGFLLNEAGLRQSKVTSHE